MYLFTDILWILIQSSFLTNKVVQKLLYRLRGEWYIVTIYKYGSVTYLPQFSQVNSFAERFTRVNSRAIIPPICQSFHRVNARIKKCTHLC